MTLEEKLDKALVAVHRIEQTQQLTVRALKLIMTELGIRKKLIEISEELEAHNGSDAPPALDSDRG